LTDLYKAILVAMQISIMAPKILKWAKKEYERVVSIFGQAVIPQSIWVYNFIYVPSDDEPLKGFNARFMFQFVIGEKYGLNIRYICHQSAENQISPNKSS
jgi:hypothetical protein